MRSASVFFPLSLLHTLWRDLACEGEWPVWAQLSVKGIDLSGFFIWCIPLETGDEVSPNKNTVFMFLLKVGFIFHGAQGNVDISVAGAGVRARSNQRRSTSCLGGRARAEPWQGFCLRTSGRGWGASALGSVMPSLQPQFRGGPQVHSHLQRLK